MRFYFLFLTLFAFFSLAQETRHNIAFKGFSLELTDDVSDEKGNHLLVGRLEALEELAGDRDSMINRIFALGDNPGERGLGIVISADKDYRTLKIVSSPAIGEKISYDEKKKKIIIGANFFGSRWQPVILLTGPELDIRPFFIDRPYSCILRDFVLRNDTILLFAESDFQQPDGVKAEKAEVIGVTLSAYKTDMYGKAVLQVLSSWKTPYEDPGRIRLSEVSEAGGHYYFSTSNLDQQTLTTIHHFYQLSDGLVDIMALSYLLSDDMPAFLLVNNFYVSPQEDFFFLTHIGATRKEMQFTRINRLLEVSLRKSIPVNAYPDFNKMLVLPNGNSFILASGASDTWICSLYNPDMQLLEEQDTGISDEYYPRKLKLLPDGRIESIFWMNAGSSIIGHFRF